MKSQLDVFFSNTSCWSRVSPDLPNPSPGADCHSTNTLDEADSRASLSLLWLEYKFPRDFSYSCPALLYALISLSLCTPCFILFSRTDKKEEFTRCLALNTALLEWCPPSSLPSYSFPLIYSLSPSHFNQLTFPLISLICFLTPHKPVSAACAVQPWLLIRQTCAWTVFADKLISRMVSSLFFHFFPFSSFIISSSSSFFFLLLRLLANGVLSICYSSDEFVLRLPLSSLPLSFSSEPDFIPSPPHLFRYPQASLLRLVQILRKVATFFLPSLLSLSHRLLLFCSSSSLPHPSCPMITSCTTLTGT